MKINKSTTTLSSVINGILEEKQCLTKDDMINVQKQEQALTTLKQAADTLAVDISMKIINI
jgi:hypothetical protein